MAVHALMSSHYYVMMRIDRDPAIGDDKQGLIPAHQPKTQVRLGIDIQIFIAYADWLLQRFDSAVRTPRSLAHLCAKVSAPLAARHSNGKAGHAASPMRSRL